MILDPAEVLERAADHVVRRGQDDQGASRRSRSPAIRSAACLVRGSSKPKPSITLTCPRSPSGSAPSAARGGASAWACAARSRAGAVRRPRRRPSWTVRGSSRGARGRCPSGDRASRHRRRPSPRFLVEAVPWRALAIWRTYAWCITGAFGSSPKMRFGQLDVALARAGGVEQRRLERVCILLLLSALGGGPWPWRLPRSWPSRSAWSSAVFFAGLLGRHQTFLPVGLPAGPLTFMRLGRLADEHERALARRGRRPSGAAGSARRRRARPCRRERWSARCPSGPTCARP